MYTFIVISVIHRSVCFSAWADMRLDLFLQSHYTRAQANSPRPIMTSSGPNPKGSQGTLASQQQSQSQQSQQPASQSHNSPGGSGREQREQRSSRSSRRKGSDSSVPEEDKDRREETIGRGEDSHHHTLTQIWHQKIFKHTRLRLPCDFWWSDWNKQYWLLLYIYCGSSKTHTKTPTI